MRLTTHKLAALPLLSSLLLACGGAEEPGPASAADAHSGEEAEADAPAELSGALQWEVPEGWIDEEPSNQMRVAQFRLPHGAGDAELGLFHFPGGGSVESNFQRWASQFEQADGGDSMEAAVFSERVVAGMTVNEMDVAGRFVSMTMPGQAPQAAQDDWRLLGAVIDTPYGIYFAKATGPAETMAHWESSFRSFLSNLRP